mmetsp:Transcript_7349/g.18857  ORF Transcript_7349/g.18857 Transcript_7349/m.18857 type:complete len:581 (-) Transcript_7349:132-1874(-)
MADAGGHSLADRMRKMFPRKGPAERMAAAISERTRLAANKQAHKLLLLSASRKIALKNSPPYLPSILVETDDLLTIIFTENSFELLKQNLHIRVFLNCFRAHCKKAIDLFKDAGEEMEKPDGPYRRQLSKVTLAFNHMVAELKAVWPEGKFNPRSTIVKHEARDFWEKSFGDAATVSWDEFTAAFGKVHRFDSREEMAALRKTVDMLDNHHVSRFEFDVFTRLFQPWKQIMNTWNVIVVAHPGYQAFITYDEVEARLQRFKRKPGSYIFRLSCTRPGQWAIGFVTSQGSIVQTIPQAKSLYQALIDGIAEGVYLYPDGQDKNPDIQKIIKVPPEAHIKVTREQEDVYESMDLTFAVCKICQTHPKGVRLEPCGHLLCTECLRSWVRESHGRETLCPFCRETVLATESIVVDPYQRSKSVSPSKSKKLDVASPKRGAIGAAHAAFEDEYDSSEDVAADYENISLSKILGGAPPSRVTSGQPHVGRHRGSYTSPAPQGDKPPALPPRTHSVRSPPHRAGSAADGASLRDGGRAGARAPPVDLDDATDRLCALGFDETSVRKALKVAKGDIKLAADILLQFGD